MLVGRVDVVELRAHGDGVQTGKCLGKETALEAGMDGLDLELGAEQVAVALLEHLAHGGMLDVAPAGILVLECGVKAQDVGERLQAVLEPSCRDVMEERGDSRIFASSAEVATTPMLEDTLDGSVGGDVATHHAVGGRKGEWRARRRARCRGSMASTSALSAISTLQAKPGSNTSSSELTAAMMPCAIAAPASAAA